MQSQEATCRLTRPELIAISEKIALTPDDAARKRLFEMYFVADSKPPRCITTGCPFGEIGKHPASVLEDVPASHMEAVHQNFMIWHSLEKTADTPEGIRRVVNKYRM